MKKIIALFSITALLFSCANSNSSQKTVNEEVEMKNVDVASFMQLVESNEGQLLDVRTADEYNMGHLEGSTNMDFYGSNFKESLGRLDENKPVFVYCKSGGRSAKAMIMMEQLGFKEVYNLKGGITAWQSANQPVVK